MRNWRKGGSGESYRALQHPESRLWLEGGQSLLPGKTGWEAMASSWGSSDGM